MQADYWQLMKDMRNICFNSAWKYGISFKKNSILYVKKNLLHCIAVFSEVDSQEDSNE